MLALLAAEAQNYALCAMLFAALLNFKHIFVYVAPAFGLFLLRRHCFDARGAGEARRSSLTATGFQSDRFVQLAMIVTAVCAASFGPFLLVGGPAEMRQIISRLFPFQRGLNHAYFAGNIWALATTLDRVLVKCARKALTNRVDPRRPRLARLARPSGRVEDGVARPDR